jgi:DNA-binding SARP family transcriptional activator
VALSITLLGRLDVARDGASVPLPRSKKTRALLAYLVATGRPQSRAQLCELLWEGPDDPRAALRWSLTKIRTILDEGATTRIVADHEQVSFAAHGAEVDMAALRDEVGLDPAGAATDALIRAAGWFQGEFLDGIDLPDCYRYHEWWTAERERLRALRVGILSTLADRLPDDPDRALTYARARLMVDPFAEAAHVAMMQLLNAAGRTREALQQYESCRRMLEGQLGAKPSATLERARAALGSVPQTTVVSPPRIDATPPTPGKPLVGRSPEVNAITAAVAEAAAGRNRDVIWISGEPGIGKTRLLEELSAQMRGRGGTVVSGRAYEV